MADRLQKTWNALARTHNRAAAPVLAAALCSPCAAVRTGAVRTLVRQRGRWAHDLLLASFAEFDQQQRSELTTAVEQLPHRLNGALADAVLREDVALCENACNVALLCRNYDLFPTLVEAAESSTGRRLAQVSAVLLRLANLLYEELSRQRADRGRRDPFFVRRQVLKPLERSVSRYDDHRRLEILDAFLLLAPPDNPTLMNILHDPHHPCHASTLATFSTSVVPGIMDQMVRLLFFREAPASVLRTVACRTDRRFLQYLLHHVGKPVSPRVLQNVRRLETVDWLEQRGDLLLTLDGPAQMSMVQIALATHLDRTVLFQIVSLMLVKGAPEGRRAACEALREFHEPAAEELLLRAVADDDPGVQAAAARLLRGRNLPGALEKLVGLLDSPHEKVRTAAASSLVEFNFERYQTLFDVLDDDTRRRTGRLVLKVDPTSTERLAELLASPSRSTRLHGIELIVAMEAAARLQDQLTRLLDDTDMEVRHEAANALRHSIGHEAVEDLREERPPLFPGLDPSASRNLDDFEPGASFHV